MKTSLLTVPLKTTEEVNWVKPLNNYLLSIYGTTSEYQDDLDSFNKLRQDLRGVNADETGIRLYYKYFSQIELLDLRVPFSKINKHKKIQFVWYDAFDSSIDHKQYALPFEKANILFNLGSLLTEIAYSKYKESTTNNVNDKLTKESIQYFQQAAGIYQFINENFLHAPSDDLNQSTIKFLIKLIVSQLQEIFVLKVINDDLEQKKNSLISKLCKSASIHYEQCYNMVKLTVNDSNVLSNDYRLDDDFLDHPDEDDENEDYIFNQVTAKIDSKWKLIVNFKSQFYKSLAYYFNGLSLESMKKYGESISYLTKSSEILETIDKDIIKPALAEKINLDYILMENFKLQQDNVRIKLELANKDNDLIYNEIVPSIITIPDIKPMDSTKIIAINENKTFQDINDYSYNNFLNNVVPINIHELLSYYSEEKSQFLRNEIDLVEVSNEELSSVLEYLKLPKSLITIKELKNSQEMEKGSTINIDEKVIEKCEEIYGKYNQDLNNKQNIVNYRNQIYEKINEIEKDIGFKPEFKHELIQLKKSLYDATNSDNQLFQLIETDQESYQIIGKGQYRKLFQVQQEEKIIEEISLLDIDDSLPSDQISETIKRIEDYLYDLNTIKTNKNKLIENLKQEIHNDDISDILILNSKVKSTNEIKNDIFPQELKKFEPVNLQLDKLITKQNELIEMVKATWKLLVENPKIQKIQNSKTYQDSIIKSQIEKINQFYPLWQKYHFGLIRGNEFYQKLLLYSNNFANKVQQNQDQTRYQYQNQHNTQRQDPIQHHYNQNQYNSSQAKQQYSSNPHMQYAPRQPSNSNSHEVNPQPQYFNQNQGNLPLLPSKSSDSKLIYDQPSTYQPNMYNFFSNR